MSISTSTPINANKSTKRDFSVLSSPEEFLELKKNRICSDTSDSSDKYIYTIDDMTDTMAGAGAQLDPSITAMITKAVQDSLLSSIEPMVNSIVSGVMSGLNTKINQLVDENTKLKQRISNLESKADASEQYSRRNNLRISGLREEMGESTDQIVMALCRDIGADITIEEIDRSHRAGRVVHDAPPRSILVKFATYRARQKFYLRKTKLKEAGHKRVFVNEDLTRPRSNLLFHARSLVKAGRIEGAWSSDGTVLVRVKQNSSFITKRIDCIDDLSQYKSYADIAKSPAPV